MERNEKVLHRIDRHGRGLEIGPAYGPVAPKRAGFHVDILDHLDRDALIRKYQHNDDADLDRIEAVDYIWNGEPYDDLIGKTKYYDWIIASHLIEHTPDLIGFLNDCDRILKETGVLSLVIPDARYCFDHFRPLTGLSKIIDAHLGQHTIHTAGTAAEYFLNVVSCGGRIAWNSAETSRAFRFSHSFEEARGAMDRVIRGREYLDIHAWCFTPHSFRLILRDLFDLGFVTFREVAFFPTEGCEFFVTLGRGGDGPAMDRLELLERAHAERCEERPGAVVSDGMSSGLPDSTAPETLEPAVVEPSPAPSPDFEAPALPPAMVPLRYRAVDRLNGALKSGLGPIHPALKWSLVRSWRVLRRIRSSLRAAGRRSALARSLVGRLRARSADQGAAEAIHTSPTEPGAIRGYCDFPGPDTPLARNGFMLVSGWALAEAGIAGVEVLIDGHPCGSLSYGSLRSDAAAANPPFQDSVNCGFSGRVTVDGLAAGEHSLVVRFLSRDGGRMEATRQFRVAHQAGSDRVELDAEYREWLAQRSPSWSELERMRAEGERLRHRPIISLIVPVDNPPEEWLRTTADSILAQTYGRWELCLVDDASTAPGLRAFLDRLAERDARIKVTHRPENLGMAGRSHAALSMASGEFIGVIEPGDLLAPSALFEVVRALEAAPDTDLLYADEDKVDGTRGLRWDPFFKPDWSPDLLLSVNYIGPFGIYRRTLVDAVGGFRPDYEGGHVYDLVLRFTERTDRIVHLPSVLFSRRADGEASAAGEPAGPQAVDAARRAIADALRRREVSARVEPGGAPGRWRVRYDLRGVPAVTLVIPTGGKMNFLRPCLESVLERSTYSNLHLLVIDNSDGTEVAELCRDVRRRDSRVRCERHRVHPFNYSIQNNFAMTLVDTPYIVLLNDDVTVITPDWVESMLEHAQRPEVGVVGARLLFPDRSLQHAGVIMGPHQSCAHAFRLFPEDHPGHHHLPHVIRNCSAVTFACAMMRRPVYDELGGLDEQNLAVAFNDVDMCLRIGERGYRVVYTPHAVLFHHESVTKNVIEVPGETEYLRRRWGATIHHDPFYNPNLTRKTDDYSLNFDAPSVPGRLRIDEAHEEPSGPRCIEPMGPRVVLNGSGPPTALKIAGR